jgi:hypothetical protein
MTTQDTPEALRQRVERLRDFVDSWGGKHPLTIEPSPLMIEDLKAALDLPAALERLRAELAGMQQMAVALGDATTSADGVATSAVRMMQQTEAERDLALWLHAEAQWRHQAEAKAIIEACDDLTKRDQAQVRRMRAERDAAVARLARAVEQREIAVSFARFVTRRSSVELKSTVDAAREALRLVDGLAAETPEPTPEPPAPIWHRGDVAFHKNKKQLVQLVEDPHEGSVGEGLIVNYAGIGDAAWLKGTCHVRALLPPPLVFSDSAPEPTAEAEPQRLVTLEESAAKFGIDLDALDDEPDVASEPPSGLDRDGDAPNELARAPRVFRAGDPEPAKVEPIQSFFPEQIVHIPRMFQAGDDEPLADVSVLDSGRSSAGDYRYLVRVADGWAWTDDPETAAEAEPQNRGSWRACVEDVDLLLTEVVGEDR